ncbi:hypothetical protein ACV8TY_15700 [Citrobacter freundii]|nr:MULTISPECIES: hypothetical protein [Citrobacter freundii complex]KLV59564.1 hypothetical protein SK34_00336 [Citrobacter sp. MGH104]
MKDKDDRKPHDSSRGGWGAPTHSGGWGGNQQDPNVVPESRLQQANRQVSQNNQHPQFDDDIPF